MKKIAIVTGSDKKYFPDIENILRKQINQCLWNIVPLSVNP